MIFSLTVDSRKGRGIGKKEIEKMKGIERVKEIEGKEDIKE